MNIEKVKEIKPKDWKMKKMSQILTVRYGRSQKDVEEKDGNFPILGTGGEIGRTNTYLYNKPSVLIGRKGTIDKPRYMDTPFWTVDTLFYTEIKQNYHPKWLYYKFCTIPWKRYNEATGVPSLNISAINSVKIDVPPYGEQHKIALILSTWDKAIELKDKLIEQKKEQKKGLMQKLLTGEVRLPGFEDQWMKVKLGDVLKERRETGFNDLELLAITSSKGVVKRTEIDIKDNSSADKSRYKRILPNDIGYNTMRMWQGVSGISRYEGIVSPAYTILKPTKNVDSLFMSYLFKVPKVINLFRRYSQGLVSDTLNLKYSNFKGIKVEIPTDINEQKEISNILNVRDKEIELLEKQKQFLLEQKKGLMQLLLTGKVRVKI